MMNKLLTPSEMQQIIDELQSLLNNYKPLPLDDKMLNMMAHKILRQIILGI